ncbi:MAG: hypothetical protein OHK0039_22220 [Bacteroidia bacterium]
MIAPTRHRYVQPAAILLAALLFQLLRGYVFYTHDNSDRALQVQITRNWMQGHGWTEAYSDPTDRSRLHYRPNRAWPPGYSLLLASAYRLAGDWFRAIEWLDALGLVLLFAGLYALLLPLADGSRAWWLLLPAWGLGFAPFGYLGSTDLWAAVGLVAMLACLQRYSRPWHLLPAAACLLLAVSMRYAYYPFALLLVVPLAGQRLRATHAASLLAALLLAVGPVWAFQQGDGAYFDARPLRETRAWLHPAQWLDADIFPLKTFIYLHPPKLATLLHLPPGWTTALLWIPALLLLVAGCAGGYALFRRHRATGLLLAATLLSNIGSLYALSLLVAAEQWGPDDYWTYVEESRYYLPAMLVFAVWLVAAWQTPTLPGRAAFRVLWSLVLLLGLTHAAGRYAAHLGGDQRLTRHSDYQAGLRWTYRYVEALSPVCYVYGDSYVWREKQSVATWAGASAVSLDSLLAHPWCTSRPLHVLIHLDDEARATFAAHTHSDPTTWDTVAYWDGLPVCRWEADP